MRDEPASGLSSSDRIGPVDAKAHKAWQLQSTACRQCLSHKQRKFSTEINIHFPGYAGLSKAGLMAFPEILVCLDCGFAEFVVRGPALNALVKGDVE